MSPDELMVRNLKSISTPVLGLAEGERCHVGPRHFSCHFCRLLQSSDYLNLHHIRVIDPQLTAA